MVGVSGVVFQGVPFPVAAAWPFRHDERNPLQVVNITLTDAVAKWRRRHARERDMAKILEFRAADEKTAVKGALRKRRSAEIVIFPGVRYERWDTPTLPTASARDHDVAQNGD